MAENKHVQISLLTNFLGEKAHRTLELVHSLVGFGLCGVFAWYGFYSTQDHFVRGVIDTQAVDVPKWIILMIIPLGFGLLSLQFLRKFFVSVCSSRIPETQKVSSEPVETEKSG